MKYKISIPEPCHEDWNKMTPNEKGRFCDSCEKTIIDFTNYSKFELAKRINSGESICGRFKTEQLNTPLNYRAPLYQKGSTWVLSLAGLLAVTVSAFAQPKSEPAFSLAEMIELEHKNLEPNKDTIILKSVVYDLGTRALLSNVNIRVKEHKKFSSMTDEYGRFALSVPNRLEEITLVFTLPTYEEKEVVVDLRQRNLANAIYLTSVEQIVETEVENKLFRLVKSTVVDSVTNETIPFAEIRLILKGEVIDGALSDFDGNFELKISPTTTAFELEISNASYEKVRIAVNLNEEPIPERIAMSVKETRCYITMGLVISQPVIEQNNDYLQGQARKYYR
jgi:hypothetical protein